MKLPGMLSILPSKASPITSPSLLITGLPEFPPIISLVEMKLNVVDLSKS